MNNCPVSSSQKKSPGLTSQYLRVHTKYRACRLGLFFMLLKFLYKNVKKHASYMLDTVIYPLQSYADLENLVRLFLLKRLTDIINIFIILSMKFFNLSNVLYFRTSNFLRTLKYSELSIRRQHFSSATIMTSVKVSKNFQLLKEGEITGSREENSDSVETKIFPQNVFA